MKPLLKTLILLALSCSVSWAQTLPVTVELPLAPAVLNPVTVLNYVQAVGTYKIAAESRIAALKGELSALNELVAKGDTLTAYDEAKQTKLEGELTIAQGKLDEVNRVINRCWEQLPRRYRNQAGLSLYDAYAQYEADLKRRGGRLLVIGAALGGGVGFFLFH